MQTILKRVLWTGATCSILGCSPTANACRCNSASPAKTSADIGSAAAPTETGHGPNAASPTAAPETASEAMADRTTAKPSSTANPGAPGMPPPGQIPELRLRLIGLHIGGGPNDPASKVPFAEVIESGLSGMRGCYRFAEDPTRGGVFGVDLRIEREGGHPTIQQLRTRMRGQELTDCLKGAFEALTFRPPDTGTTVISVSLRFSLGE